MRKIGVVGLGYVGLPVAVAFGRLQPVLGYDYNPYRIETLQRHFDYTLELSEEELKHAQIMFTAESEFLGDCDFIIVTVPTPIDEAKKPDLRPLISASQTVGKYLREGTIVVYESTVYPGTTEEVCLPILEECSSLKAGKDFFVGYSPERINPGDKEHSFERIVKVVSAQDEETLSIIESVYGMVVQAGVFRASSIKVAEAAKVIENTQRDLNIALMNELAVIFDRLGIDTLDVLRTAGTKWNFLRFSPGLVGGHCIGVDPYYLTYKAEEVGYHPEVILAGRRINDHMGAFVASSLIKKMIHQGIQIQHSIVTVLGLTFKENVTDIRNSKVVGIIKELEQYGIQIQITDPFARAGDVEREWGLHLTPIEELNPAHAIVLAVPHEPYKNLGWEGITSLLLASQGVVADVRSMLDSQSVPPGVSLWRL